MRLHAIAEELTKQTGVTIRSGSNSQDWRVRDIPVIVCVKNMPLGKLLEHIAQCTHVRFVAEKIAGAPDNTSAYRLCRNKSREDDIGAQIDAVAEANLKLSLWAWDTLVAYADMPDASADIPTTKPYGFFEIDAQQVRILGQALKALGPDGRAKAATGEQVTVKISESPAYAAVYDYGVKHPGPAMLGATPLEPTAAERVDALLALRIMRDDEPTITGGFSFDAYGIPALADPNDSAREWHAWEAQPVLCARALAAVEKLKLPPPPDVDVALASDVLFPDPKFKLLKTDDDWKVPKLQMKIKLELPQTKAKYFTRAEILTALAKTANMDIICEDFDSQMLPQYWAVRIDPKSEATVGSLLNEATPLYNVHWFINGDAKLIIGWAENWRKRHRALVAESFVAGLRARREKSGLELDDVVPFWDLTKDQIRDWFSETPDFTGVACDSICDYGAGMWRLYGALTGEDKALARSSDGLTLAKLDPRWVIDILQRAEEESRRDIIELWIRDQTPREKERARYVSNPDMIGKLTLKVTPEPLESWDIRPLDEEGYPAHQHVVSGPNGPFKHSYLISLTDPKAGADKLYWNMRWYGVPFPVFTPEHEAELIKKAKNKEKK